MAKAIDNPHLDAGEGVIAVLKGKTERWTVSTWESKSGKILVSTGLQYLGRDGEYHFKKGGFALTPEETRELCDALLKTADIVQEMNDEREAEEDGR